MEGMVLDRVNLTIVVILAVSVLALVYTLILQAALRYLRMSKRMAAMAQRWQSGAADADTVIPSIRREIPTISPIFRKLLPDPDRLRLRLLQSGRSITVGQYVLGSLVIGLLAAVLITVIIGFSIPVAILGACVAGFALPHLIVSYLCSRRQQAFTSQFPEGIELIIRGLRTGQPLIESVTYLADEMPAPIGPEFQNIVDSVQLGNTVEDALKAALLRIDTPEFRFFATAVTIQQTTGGNLGETLGKLADMLRKRQQMRQRIKAIVSESRASAWILGSLPFVMFVILFVVEASYVMKLFHDPRGQLLVGLALLSQFVGVAIMVRMVKFKI